METLDFNLFIRDVEPFNTLEPSLQAELIDSVDIHYFKPEESILKQGEAPEHYYIIAKGLVQELEGETHYSSFSTKDSFDAGSVLQQANRHDFIALEETLCFAIPSELFTKLIKTDPRFESYYLNDISHKMQTLLTKDINQDLAFFMANRVKDCFIRQPVTVDQGLPIIDAVRLMSEKNSDFLLVDFGETHGIVTNTNLREKVILPARDTTEPIGMIATPRLVTIRDNDFLFNALLLMIENSIQRLAVTGEQGIVGVIEQVDLLSAVSSKAHLTNFMIEKATDPAELKEASADIITLIKSLQKQGVKTRHITKLLADLNAKLYRKLFTLLAPDELVENSCLIVLGSEGRKEQTLRTDQDNALILRDGFTHPGLESITQQFTQALLDFGFPECEGGIMLSRPAYCKPFAEYDRELFEITQNPSGENIMKLAIFYDSSAICGDVTLLEGLKQRMADYLQNDTGFYAHFARATLLFETPLSLFSGFITEKKEHKDELDIKKGGIFPIVHGIRSLALQMQCETTNTIERIKELNGRGIFDKEFSKELMESFTFLLTLRLNRQLANQELGRPIDNYINPKQLSKLERDVLRDVFKIVDQFKKLVAHHFKLNMVG